jgi:hypothetical protein
MSNGQDYVGGYFVGSETYIPAKDIFHNFVSHPVSWKYAFERQWLLYQQWGRLLYDPTVTDALFAQSFKTKYNTQDGDKLVEAFKLSSRYILEMGNFFNRTWDFTLYSEGFLFGDNSVANNVFISLEKVISATPMDSTYMGVNTYVNKTQSGTAIGATVITPIVLANRLIADATEALSLATSISTNNKDLLVEIQDVKALSYLSLYFANKIKAAERLATYRKTGNAAHKTEAVEFIESAVLDWQNVVSATSHLVEGPLPHTHSLPFSWAGYQSVVAAEVQWVKNQ